MPPHIEVAPVFGMALYSAEAVLAGRAGDVCELVTENLYPPGTVASLSEQDAAGRPRP